MVLNLIATFAILLSSHACVRDHSTGYEWRPDSLIREIAIKDYPDDPDLLVCDSVFYGKFSHREVIFIQEDNDLKKFTIKFTPKNTLSDTIVFSHISLDEWIPTVPDFLKGDPLLSQIAIFNQQFNRVQVKFEKGNVQLKGNHQESEVVTRVDLAKNCLHLPLWEIIAYKKTTDAQGHKRDAPVYHGWFNFPYDLHTELMKRKGWSDEEARKYTHDLSHWGTSVPSEKVIDLKNLRTVQGDEVVLPLTILNDAAYPMQEYDERWKKMNNILYPKRTLINSFLTDSTQFAKFISPGVYRRRSPMPTQLGRFRLPTPEATLRRITSKNKAKTKSFELELEFSRSENPQEITRLLFGGFDIKKIDTLAADYANKAIFQMPMGISNHYFNQPYKTFVDPANPATDSPWYAMVLGKRDRWLNSHEVGVDGVLLHFDKDDPQNLHIWLLAFERHALVGHFVIRNNWEQFREPAQ